jgi:hypothetical protein
MTETFDFDILKEKYERLVKTSNMKMSALSTERNQLYAKAKEQLEKIKKLRCEEAERKKQIDVISAEKRAIQIKE